MNITNINPAISALFLQASIDKFRFESPKGALTTEDLWDLPLTSNTGKANLDDIAKSLNAKIKAAGSDVSFVKPEANKDNVAEKAKFDIVLFVINTKVAERDAAAEARVKADKKQKIMELIERKKNQELEGQSVEDLQAMLDSL